MYIEIYYTIMTMKDKKANTDFFDYKFAPFLGNLVTIAKTCPTFSLPIHIEYTKPKQPHK